MKTYSKKEILGHLKGYKKHGGSVNRYAVSVGLKTPTMRAWLIKNKVPLNTVTPIETPLNNYLQDESKVDDEVAGDFAIEEQIRIVKDVIVHERNHSEVTARLKLKRGQLGYWIKKWSTGKLIIPGLVPPKVNTTRAYGGRSKAPLQFDHSAQTEIGKLNAQNQYLKDLLEENEIEYELDRVVGKAKDNYLLAIIKNAGIDIEFSNGVPA